MIAARDKVDDVGEASKCLLVRYRPISHRMFNDEPDDVLEGEPLGQEGVDTSDTSDIDEEGRGLASNYRSKGAAEATSVIV